MLWSPCKVLPFSSKILISVGILKKKDKQDYKKSFNLIHILRNIWQIFQICMLKYSNAFFWLYLTYSLLPLALKFYLLMNPAKMTRVTYSELELEKTLYLSKLMLKLIFIIICNDDIFLFFSTSHLEFPAF